MTHNIRLYAVGRGISARYEIFWQSGCDWGERSLQYAVEPRLPYTALLGHRAFYFLYKFFNYHPIFFSSFFHVVKKFTFKFIDSLFFLIFSGNLNFSVNILSPIVHVLVCQIWSYIKIVSKLFRLSPYELKT